MTDSKDTFRPVSSYTEDEVIDWLDKAPEPIDGGLEAATKLKPADFLMLNLVQLMAAKGALNSRDLNALSLNTNKSMLAAGLVADDAAVGQTVLLHEAYKNSQRRERKENVNDASFAKTLEAMVAEMFGHDLKEGTDDVDLKAAKPES
jgi:hypothetical protein